MNDIFNEIEKLFEGETLDFPPSTSLDKAAELSGLGKAVVLFLSDEQGAIRAVSDLEKTVAMPGFVEIASKCSDLLRQDDSCTVGGSPSSPEAFAIRLGNSSRRSILGGVGQLPEDSSDWLAENATMLRVCGELAWQAVNEESIRRKLETQVRHLRSEEETLKAAHTEASATAVEEQARRLQEEREKEAMMEACMATETANRAKSDFLANMSHEIRTPLNAILGFTELLRKGADGGDENERQEYLATIHESGMHLLELINNILDLSKIEAGRMDIERIDCSPHDIVNSVVSVLRVKAEEKGLYLECEWPDPLPDIVKSDPVRLKQLLINLVGNAVKFTSSGGVRIVTRLIGSPGDRLLTFDVIDTGIGIDSEKMEGIFDAFSQADTSVTREFGGTGLGLAISRRISAALGGELEVRSKVGEGSVFTATIHVGSLEGAKLLDGPSNGAASETMTSAEPDAILPPARILLVEDGSTNRRLISLILKRAGAEVVTAENGKIGVQQATEGDFDAILMDMQMPVMDGYSATRKLRELNMDLPIIALTAHAMSGDEEKCREAGCSGYLPKPVDSGKLLQLLAGILTTPRTASEVADRQSSSTPPPEESVLVSNLPTDDEDFREIVEEFVDKLHEKVAAINGSWADNDMESLAFHAHWIKGSGGTAGFPALTEPAGKLEQLAKQELSNEIPSAIQAIEHLASRIVSPSTVT